LQKIGTQVPAVVIVDGNPNNKSAIQTALKQLQHHIEMPMPVILLLTSRELKKQFLTDFHPWVHSVIFKPVSPRLLLHQLQRYFSP